MTTIVNAGSLNRVLLTGAASGIGKACATKLMHAGVDVCALDIVEPDFTVSDFHPLDLADAQSIDQAVKFAHKHGRFDALLNVAGVPPRSGEAVNVLTINWLGQSLLTQGVLSALEPGASIVNMASKAGGRWHDNLDQVKSLLTLKSAEDIDAFVAAHSIDATRAYNLSKEAMIVWAMASTAYLKEKNIRMNSVSPAAVETDILNDFKTAFGPMVEKNLAKVGRPGQPEEIANVTLFLASPESHWLQGSDIVVDGGMGAIIQSEMMQLDGQSLWT